MTFYIKDQLVLLEDSAYPEFQKYTGWYINSGGYVVRKPRAGLSAPVTYFLHYLVLPPKAGLDTDHIDRNKLNNLLSNLRYLEHWQNGHNRGLQINNTSGMKGVSWNRIQEQWHVYIWIKGKRTHLGFFDDLEEAKIVRLQAEQQLVEL